MLEIYFALTALAGIGLGYFIGHFHRGTKVEKHCQSFEANLATIPRLPTADAKRLLNNLRGF